MANKDGFLLSTRDYPRVQDMLRWFERNHRNLKPEFRRRIVMGGGGGGAATIWAVVTQAPEYNDPAKAKYVVQKASVDTDNQSETYNEWVGDGVDIAIERALGFEGHIKHEGLLDAMDIRNWHPWPPVGSVVPIIEKWDYEQAVPALRWYMDIDMVYGGKESDSSIRVDDETLITQAVWA